MKTDPMSILNNGAELCEHDADSPGRSERGGVVMKAMEAEESRRRANRDTCLDPQPKPAKTKPRRAPEAQAPSDIERLSNTELESRRRQARDLIVEIDACLVERRFRDDAEPALPPERLRLIKASCDAVRGFWGKPRYIDIISAALATAGRDGLVVGDLSDVTGIPVRRIENVLVRARGDGEVVQLERRRWRIRVEGRNTRRQIVWVLAQYAEGQKRHVIEN